MTNYSRSVLKSNGPHRSKNPPVKFGFSLKTVPANIVKKLPSQRCPQPFLIAFFNFSHKWPTFAFTDESGYTLGFRRKIAHKGTHGETRVFRMGWYYYPRSVPHVHEHPRAGCQNGVLCRFGILAGRCSRRTQKAFGTAMRLCVSLFRRRRGPAGLRDPIAVSLTALIGFTVLADRDYRVRKKAHFVFMRRAVLPALPAPSAALLYALMH